MRGTVASGAAVVLLVASTPVLATGPAPLERARHAAEQMAFAGVLSVRWRDGGVIRSERLTVQAADGALMVRGANQVMARPAFGRLLAHRGGGWQEMWLPSRAPTPRPDGVPKYEMSDPALGGQVAGRPTKVIEVHHRGRLLERIHLDAATELLLQRDQYDAEGAIVRTLGFESIDLDPSVPAPTAPSSPAKGASKEVSPDDVAAPATLGEGYERMGAYRKGAVLQVLYSDGVYDISLFQQSGRLRTSDLPKSGDKVELADATGWRYAWPGGQVVVWSEGGSVFTAVSDAPPDQVVAAVRSLPPIPTRELSLLGKIRRACQALMEPLS